MAEINLTEAFWQEIGTVLNEVEGVDNYPHTVPVYAALPCIVYNMIASSKANQNGPSFDSDTETFMVQVSVYNNDLDDSDLYSIQAQIESVITDRSNWTIGLLDAVYVGGSGPIIDEVKGYRRYDKTFLITVGK